MPLNICIDDNYDALSQGTLYVVSTPIGNMDDITLRALKTLSAVDMIIAEDTRHTGKLLSRYNIRTQLISCHEHNEKQRVAEVIAKLQEGRRIALVSDAGTPSVSDPGYHIVKGVIENALPVVPVPGVSAAVTALSVSGLPTDAFVFMGFPSRKKGKREEQIAMLKEEKKTAVFYESPKRVLGFLNELEAALGKRECVLGREMTKLHEEFIRGDLTDVIFELENKDMIKGECTVLLKGADPLLATPEMVSREIRLGLENEDLKPSALAKKIAQKLNVSRSSVYEEILQMTK